MPLHLVRCIRDLRHASCSTLSGPPHHSTAPPSRQKLPRSCHSWPHPGPATSPGRSSPSMAAAPLSDYATGSAKSEIKGIGEEQCPRHWKERLHSLRAARAALVLQSPSVWLRTERTWPSHTRKVPTRPRRSSRRLNAVAERRSQFRRTPLMLAPSKPRSKGPWRHSAGSTSL